MADEDPKMQKIIVVSGPSGAGRSTAINVLEDLGFETIDNAPLTVIPRLAKGPVARPLAIGVDVRNRDFSISGVKDILAQLRVKTNIDCQMLFLDASEDTLVRRYSETRRRHPLAPDEPPIQGIRREADLLAPLRTEAEFLIDTSDLSPHDLKAYVTQYFGDKGAALFGITLQSFSYKRGIPKGADMVFDCRFLKNPYWEESLRGLTGLDGSVGKHIETDSRTAPFLSQLIDLLSLLLPAFREEGKSHVSIAIGCTGGQHRSVFVTERVGLALAEEGWQVSKRHREINRMLAALPSRSGS